MFHFTHYIKGFFKYLTNSKISLFAFVSANNQIDKTVAIYRGAKVKASKIGRHTYIGANTDVENAMIGNFCSIADHCRIGMASHTLDKLSTSPIFTQKINGCRVCWCVAEDCTPLKNERAFIGNDVWIGSHVLVNGGVHIGNGAVIGAGAVVVKDIPPYAIAVGVPARVVRFRFEEPIITKLNDINWWDRSDEELKRDIRYFQSSENIISIIEAIQ